MAVSADEAPAILEAIREAYREH